MRIISKCLIALALLIAIPAFAATDPPARVGRVSLVSGILAYFGSGDTAWSNAAVNLPVAVGGWFATDPQSRAQLRIGANSVNLSSDTQLNVADLRDKVMQIALTQGRIDLHLRRATWRKDETVQIDIARGGVWLLQAGIYDIDGGGAGQPTRIMVFEGSARFVGGGIDMVVKAGDTLVVSGADQLAAVVERAAPDAFVRWCRAHDYRDDRVARSRRVLPGMTGFEELDDYGEWVTIRDHGAVWFPKSLPAKWAPYREGNWAWVDPWGWNWVDDQPWGFAPSHYGRWARVDNRWGWAPGEFVTEPVYAPALVAFIPPPAIEGPPVEPRVGWFPLAPGELYWPSYSSDPTYFRRINITSVNLTRINTVTTAMLIRPPAAEPPPQIVNQPFLNRGAATVVPTQTVVTSGRVAPAVVPIPVTVLQQTTVIVAPPPAIAPPTAATVATIPAQQGSRPEPPRPFARGERNQSVTATPPTAGPQVQPNVPARPNLPARPNFAGLDPAPRVGHAGRNPPQPVPAAPQGNPPAAAQPAPPAAAPHSPPQGAPLGAQQRAPLPTAGTQPIRPGAQPAPPASATPAPALPAPAASATPTGVPSPPAQANPPATAQGRPSGPPDFSRLEPQRDGPRRPGQPPQQSATPQPPAQQSATSQPTPQPPPQTGAAGAPPGLPTIRPGAQPPAQTATPRPNPGHPAGRPDFTDLAAPRRDNRSTPPVEQTASPPRNIGPAPLPTSQTAPQPAPSAALPSSPPARIVPPTAQPGATVPPDQAQRGLRDQAKQRETGDAVARQQAEQRAGADAAARQQAATQQAQQQRAAADAAARQQAAAQQAQQQRAAEAAARQQAAAQQAQQQRAAEAAARQQAAAQQAQQQRAAQQAQQQRAAAEAAARQQAAQQAQQQRAAAEAAARQQRAQSCGFPGGPPCPR